MRLLCLLLSVVAFLPSAFARPRVVTTHTVLEDFVRVIGGDSLDVDCILPNNVDPHTFEPKPTDVRRLAKADLVVVNGFGLEPWADKLIQNSGFRGEVLVAADSVPESQRIEVVEHGNDDALRWDPHAWQNPANAARYVGVIAEALVRIDPANTTKYRLAAETYQRQLAELDTYASKKFSAIPPARRQIVTTHDSLRYLAKHYNFQLISVLGPQPDHEPSARELAQIVTNIRKSGATVVFLESTTSAKIARVIAEETHTRVVSELYTDSLGAKGTPAETYLGMFKLNVDTLAQALE
ncbi:MAG TPA: metal ABC transporter substrate-binding protein [Opitutaceae bacterium]|nr:metal ABC transporter substrate-binding protein [Opitutaceae bacterium]